MTVNGWSMGKTGYTGRARGVHTGMEWVSASAVRCRVGEGGGGTRRAVVTAGGRAGRVTEAWSTDVPGVSVMGGVNVVCVCVCVCVCLCVCVCVCRRVCCSGQSRS